MSISPEVNEPLMPSNLGGMPDPETGEYNSNDTSGEEIQQTPPEEENLDGAYQEAPEEETEIKNQENNQSQEEPIKQEDKAREEAKKALLEGWGTDRDRNSELTKENIDLREKLARYEEEDEDFLGLSEKERVDKLVERREKERQLKEEREKAETDSEINWHRANDPYFQQNQERILKNAVAFNSSSLADAIKVTKNQDALTKQSSATTKYNDKRKKAATGAGKGKSGGTHVTDYDPKVDGDKSISQLYSEGGI